MIHATFPGALEAAAADTATRTVAGVGVPWNVAGRVSSGETVIFHPGSIDPAGRPPVLRDHDRQRTIGRVADAADTGAGLAVTARVSRTPLGDESLVLAGDGALMFSIGADPTEWDYDDEGRLHVHAATWLEQTLLPIGAYTGAVVTDVTAAYPEGGTMPATDTELLDPELTDTPEPDDPDTPPAEPEDPEQPDTVEAGRVPLAGARGAAGRRTATRSPYAAITLRQVARIICASRGGDPGAVRHRDLVLAAQGAAAAGSIEAALADVVMVSGVGAAVRPAYQAELVEIIGWGTPTIDALRQGDLERGDYPTKTFNRWTATPEVALQVAEKDEIHSVPVTIGPSSATVQTWAGGNDISQQTLDFGSPSFVEDYIRAAGVDYAQQADTYAVNTLLAGATDVPTVVGDTFIGVLGKLIGALSPATTPPGGLFCAVSYDVGTGLIGVPRDEGPAFWDGSVSFGTFTPTVNAGGLSVFVDPNLPARTYLLGHRQGATWYDLPGTPFSLRAVNVGLLGLDVAVYGYGALGLQYPGAFVKTTQPIA